jgi:hypothetical protein
LAKDKAFVGRFATRARVLNLATGRLRDAKKELARAEAHLRQAEAEYAELALIDPDHDGWVVWWYNNGVSSPRGNGTCLESRDEIYQFLLVESKWSPEKS